MNTPSLLGRTPSKNLIYGSLLFAILFNFIPFGQSLPVPDMVAVVLVFWNAFLPSKVGLIFAWILGIIMDIHAGSLLGQHALAYSVLSYGAISLHRRLLWYSTFSQTVQIVPLFAISGASDHGGGGLAKRLWGLKLVQNTRFSLLFLPVKQSRYDKTKLQSTTSPST